MSLGRNPSFERKLQFVSAQGIELPAELAALIGRLREFENTAQRTPVLGRVADAIISGDTAADTELHWAAALGESNHSDAHRIEMIDAVRHSVIKEIRALYGKCADANYRTLAARYNETAAALVAAIAVTNPEADPATLIEAPDKERKAWTAAATHAAELTKQLPSLHAAASLAGYCGDEPDELLALCVDVTGHDRDELWRAWDTDRREDLDERKANNSGGLLTLTLAKRTRTRRWGALLGMRATLRAADSPIEPYGRKAPAEPVPQIEVFTS